VRHAVTPPTVEHTWPAPQTVPQVPQFVRSVPRLTQVPPQLVCPVGQRQTPIWQLVPPPHTVPHAPQWLLSLSRLRHALAAMQKVCPLGQVQVPPLQNLPLVHALPQAPQLALSELTGRSQPLLAMPSQSRKPALQAITRHPPATHTAVALGRLHALPQAPQWLVSVWVLTSQPFASIRSQSARPVLHEPTTQLPPVQAGVPLATVQALRQAPQWATLVWVLTSQPLVLLPSQLASGAVHIVVSRLHTPALQRAVAPAMEGQRVPQRAQWAGLVARLTSQPLAAD